MPNIVSSKLFDHTDTNPGAPSKNSGPMHPPSVWDHLPLPGGSTVGKVDNDTLRKIFHRIGVPDSHHLGRDRLCERYNSLLHKIHKAAGDAAIERWLEQYKDETNAGIQ